MKSLLMRFNCILGALSQLCAAVTAGILLFIICFVLAKGVPALSPKLFALKYTTENLSMFPAIVSTLIITGVALIIALPFGIGSAIYLSEYARRGSRLVRAIRLAAETLAGVPSIVYGMFGLLFFVGHLGFSVISGSLTLALMILPLTIRATEEALLSVPDSYREGVLALGAGKLKGIYKIILPSAAQGILAGVILAIGRIVGETAALIYTAGTVAKIPGGLGESARTLSVHMYALYGEGLHTGEAYATAVVLLAMTLAINGLWSALGKRACFKGS